MAQRIKKNDPEIKNDSPLTKILYIYQSGQEEAQKHIISYLRENNCDVDAYLIPGSPSRHYQSALWGNYPTTDRRIDVFDLKKEEFIEEHKKLTNSEIPKEPVKTKKLVVDENQPIECPLNSSMNKYLEFSLKDRSITPYNLENFEYDKIEEDIRPLLQKYNWNIKGKNDLDV